MAARKQYPLRIDPKLWAELEAWAQDELRSVNGQIEYILRRAVAQRKRSKQDEPGEDSCSEESSPPEGPKL